MQKIEDLCQSHEHMVHGEMQLLVILGQILVFAPLNVWLGGSATLMQYPEGVVPLLLPPILLPPAVHPTAEFPVKKCCSLSGVSAFVLPLLLWLVLLTFQILTT